jgi:3-hydroxyisobutyrate dehydrogenase
LISRPLHRDLFRQFVFLGTDVITNGAPGSPLVKTVAGRMTTPGFTPNLLLQLMSKDLNCAIQEGDKLSIELITAMAALEDFQRAIE